MFRKLPLVLILVVVATVAACGFLGGRDDRPNILLISIDSLRADHLSCYGYERSTLR